MPAGRRWECMYSRDIRRKPRNRRWTDGILVEQNEPRGLSLLEMTEGGGTGRTMARVPCRRDQVSDANLGAMDTASGRNG